MPITKALGNQAGFSAAVNGETVWIGAVALTDSAGNELTGATANQVQGNVASAATDAGNPVKVGAKYNSALPTFTNGQRGDLQIGTRGSLSVQNLFADSAVAFVGLADNADTVAVSATADKLGILSRVTVFNGTNWDRARGDTNGLYTVSKPVTSGGVTIARLVGSAGANIKNSAGQVYSGVFTNTNAAIRYLQLYNKASAATLSTDTPVITVPLPPNATVQFTTDGLGAAFATGISWAFTTDDVAIPTTAGATTDIHGTLLYK